MERNNMAGQQAGGAMNTLGMLLAPNTMRALQEQKDRQEQRAGIGKLLDGLNAPNQAPLAQPSIAQREAIPGLNIPAGPSMQLPTRPEIPAFGDNKGLPGRFSQADLPGANQLFKARMVANAFPGAGEAIASSILAPPEGPIKVGKDEVLLDYVTKKPIFQNRVAEPPKLESIFDSNGREIKAYVMPDGSYRPVGSAKADTAKEPTNPVVQEFFDEETGRPYKAQWNAATKSWERQGGFSMPSKSFNNDQNLSAGFANRLDLADKELTDISENYPGFDPTSYIEGAGTATSLTTSAANQRYRQAQENWVTANLRKESGAAIGKDEMDREIKKYFPQPGDKAPLVEQKARAREAARQSLVFASGGAYDALKKSQPEIGPTKTPTITNDGTGKAAYDALKPGQKYIDPNGVTRVKK